MHPEQIKAALRMKGITSAALADEMGVSGATLSQVISGRTVSARIQERIARHLGQPVAAIWPASGKPILRRTKATALSHSRSRSGVAA